MGAGTTEVRDSTTDVLLEAAVWDPAAVSRTQRRLHLVSEAGRRYERTVDPAISVAALDRCATLLAEIARRHRRTHADRLARRPAARRLVTAAGQHGRRPARPHRGRRLRARHHGEAPHPDRRRGRRRRRSGHRDAAELAPRHSPARRPRRRGAAAGGARDHPVGAAAGAGRARPHPGAEAPPCDRKVVGAQRLRRDPADPVPARRGVRPVGPAARRPAPLDHRGAEPAGIRPARSWPPRCCRDSWRRWAATCPAAPSMPRCSPSLKSWSPPRKPAPWNASRPSGGPPRKRSPRWTRRCRVSRSMSAWCWPACASLRARGVRAGPSHASDAFEAVRVIGRAAGVELTLRPAQYLPWHPGRCAEVVDRRHRRRACRTTASRGRGAVRPAEGHLRGRTRPGRHPDRRDAARARGVAVPGGVPGHRLIVGEDVAAQSVVDAVRDGAGELLEDVRLFDVYTGPQIGEGRKSLTLALRFRAADRTLTEDEASAARDAAVQRPPNVSVPCSAADFPARADRKIAQFSSACQGTLRRARA